MADLYVQHADAAGAGATAACGTQHADCFA